MKNLGQRWVNAIAQSESIAEWVPFVAEISAGSRQKYALDKRSGQLVLHRAMADGIHYPTNYGFVPRTLSAADHMELDLMAISTEPLLPLTIARVHILGGCTLKSTDERLCEDKLLGAVIGDPDVDRYADLADVDETLKARIEELYTSYKSDEGASVIVEHWFDRMVALDKIKAGLKAWRKSRG